jgi:hypothetical protein
MLVWEIASVHAKNHMNQINKPCTQNAELLIIKADGHTVTAGL